MSLQGLPDFQQPLLLEDHQIFYPYEGVGLYTLTPSRLELATQPNGRPDFLVELIRSDSPDLPPAPHGRLTFGLQPSYAMSEALPLLRRQHKQAALTQTSFRRGFLRLQLTAALGTLPAELLQPVELGWSSSSLLRFALTLSVADALIIIESLADAFLPLQAVAELEMKGISPRLPLRVRFQPAHLLGDLLAHADAERRISRLALLNYFQQEGADLPFTLSGRLADEQRQEFAEIMTDRVRMRFGELIPAPQVEQSTWLRLAPLSTIAGGRFVWDLQEPLITLRPFTLRMNPFALIQQLAQAGEGVALQKRTVIPALPTGFQPLSIVTYLPMNCQGVVRHGVTIRLPTLPPFRPQPLVKIVEFAPQQSEATIEVQAAPGEKPAYTYSTFLQLAGSAIGFLGDLREVVGPGQPPPGGLPKTKQVITGGEIKQQGDHLEVTLNDYPVTFVPLTAAPTLLAIADVEGLCSWLENDQEQTIPFALTRAQPAITLVLPVQAQQGRISITAIERQDQQQRYLDNLPVGELYLDLYLFAEYGPQRVAVTAKFTGTATQAFLELLPEGRPETGQEITLLRLTATQPRQEWQWFALSPFLDRYRYRFFRGSSETPAPWSAVRSAQQPLQVTVG